jgi:hypothetical protein
LAFDIDVPIPVSERQMAAIKAQLKLLEGPIRSWPDFERRVLQETQIDSKPLLESLPKMTHFWIETLSPSPGFPRKILFKEWVPPKWRSGSQRDAQEKQ